MFVRGALPLPCPRSGDIYEHHALAILQAGSEEGFTTYALNPSLPELAREAKLQLPAGASDVVYFDKCAELVGAAVGGAHSDRIWVPRAKNFAAIDLILPGQRPANFTINETHSLLLFAKKETQGLIPVAESLGLPSAGRIPFYWVMPRDSYDRVRRRGATPFPVVLRAPFRNNTYGTAHADGTAQADCAPADGGGSEGVPVEDDADGGAVVTASGGLRSGAASPAPSALSGGAGARAAAPAASVPVSATPTLSATSRRGRGRPRKQPAAQAHAATPVVDDYARRIDQYLLLVPFDVLTKGAPTPPATLP